MAKFSYIRCWEFVLIYNKLQRSRGIIRGHYKTLFRREKPPPDDGCGETARHEGPLTFY
jgi:hypothetical protein